MNKFVGECKSNLLKFYAPKKHLPQAVILISIVGCSLLPSISSATAYKYTYTGNTMTTTYTSRADEPPPYDINNEMVENHISVTFFSPTLLSNSTNNQSFSISLNGGLIADVELKYPYPYSLDPSSGPGSASHPNYVGIFDISAVDNHGIPLDWNISVDYNYYAPTGHFTQTFLGTSLGKDTTYGGYEGFYSYLGQLDTNPGTWVITAVPEPNIYAMLTAGLGLVVFIAKKHQVLRQFN